MRLQNGEPTDLYLNAHNFGAFYKYQEIKTWPGDEAKFIFNCGKKYSYNDQEMEVPYPKAVSIVEGSHPELFAANGSHGIWGASGKFEYSRYPSLADFTSRGIGWRLRYNLVFVDPSDSFSGTDLQWLDFRGRWGNDETRVA